MVYDSKGDGNLRGLILLPQFMWLFEIGEGGILENSLSKIAAIT